jgi:hypothetical protein
MQTFNLYSDPGHGWLRVGVGSVYAVGLTPASFSKFSYHRGPWLYLEEDCDASLFVKAYMDRHNRPPVVKEHHSNSHSVIRNYPRIAA